MTLRVVGAGMGRTGTHSLKLALERLVAEPCYHMFECIERPEHMLLWTAAAQGDSPDWDELFSGYGAAVDFPASAFWPELVQAYPDALILLSVRDTEGWWRSASETIFPAVLSQPQGPFRDMLDALWSARFTLAVDDESAAKAAYEAFNDRVRAEAPPERLLEWHPGDGWGPICAALGLPVPDEPFPHANTKAEFWELRADRLEPGRG